MKTQTWWFITILLVLCPAIAWSQPVVSIVDPADGELTNLPSRAVSGLTDALGQQVDLVFQEGQAGELTATAMADPVTGLWTYSPPMAWPEGVVTVRASVTDMGQTGTAQSSFELDTSDPTLSVTSPMQDQTLTSASIQFAGDTEAGVTIEVILDPGTPQEQMIAGVVTGTTFVATSGALSDGAHVAQVTARDAAGNKTTIVIDVIVNAVATPIQILSPVDLGQLNDATPTIEGIAEPNASIQVTLKEGTSVLESSTIAANPSGDWSYQINTPLPDNTYRFEATANDGMNLTLDAVTFKIDTIAPTISFTGPMNGSTTTDRTPAFEGIAGQADTLVTLIFDPGTPQQFLDTTRTNASRQFFYSPPQDLALGVHQVVAAISDVAGNLGTASVSVVVIGTGLNVAILSPLDGSVGKDANLQISGIADPGLGVTVQLRPLSGTDSTFQVTADGTGAWTVAPPTLVDGRYRVTATVTQGPDTAIDSVAFELDTVSPEIQVLEPTGFTRSGIVVVRGRTEPRLEVFAQLADGPTVRTVASPSGGWSASFGALEEGVYNLTARTEDPAGNRQESSSVFVVDRTPPTVIITSPDARATLSTAIPTFAGQAEVGLDVEVFVDDELLGVVPSNGAWQLNTPVARAMGNGTHVAIARVVDQAANVAETEPLTFVVDAPQDADGDGLTDAEEDILGTDSTLIDTDGDGLTDGEEALGSGTDPLRRDTDRDGLTDKEELRLGSNPRDDDTDNDGLVDGRELDLGTSIFISDTDGGGVDDGTEVNQLQSDPLDGTDDFSVSDAGVAGGCATTGVLPNPAFLLFALLGLGLIRRRRA